MGDGGTVRTRPVIGPDAAESDERSLALGDDEQLSRAVVRTECDGEPVLFNTITKFALPVSSSAEQLARELFLPGQERDAIERALFRPRDTLALTVISTWECNLRCTHCSVLRRLVRKQEDKVDAGALAAFVQRYLRAFPELRSLRLTLLGGEPLLEPRLGLALVERLRGVVPEATFDTTTNLACDLDDDVMALVSALDRIVVSVDGLEVQHDAQRRPYRRRFSPYERTTDNVRRLVESGLSEKIWVQGAIRDEFATRVHLTELHRTLVRLGVPYDRISFETLHPTEHSAEPQSSYVASLRRPSLRDEVCCKFRGARSLVIEPDGSIVSDFYDRVPLGTLEDNPEMLVEQNRSLVLETMPALHDETCQSCPVIGYCWGGCSSGQLLTKDRPSAHCNQRGLVELVRKKAVEGALVGSP